MQLQHGAAAGPAALSWLRCHLDVVTMPGEPLAQLERTSEGEVF